MLTLKVKHGIPETMATGGIIKFDANGLAKGLYDLNGKRISKTLPKETIKAFEGNPSFTVLRIESSGNVAADLLEDDEDEKSSDEWEEEKEEEKDANIASSKTVATKKVKKSSSSSKTVATKKVKKSSSSKKDIEVD